MQDENANRKQALMSAAHIARAAMTGGLHGACLLYTSPSPRDIRGSRMPSSA